MYLFKIKTQNIVEYKIIIFKIACRFRKPFGIFIKYFKNYTSPKDCRQVLRM